MIYIKIFVGIILAVAVLYLWGKWFVDLDNEIEYCYAGGGGTPAGIIWRLLRFVSLNVAIFAVLNEIGILKI